LNPVISKLFEHCLLHIFNSYLHTSSAQFGFKARSGCNKAIYSVRKTIDFFVSKNCTVNLCTLDIEKAFDKLNRHALFMQLLNRRCPLTLLNILDHWLEKSFAFIRWGEARSDLFRLRAGTRQGGVCSPALFAVCINDVLCKLQDSGLGCYIRQRSFNAGLFADDIVLLSISIDDLREILYLCIDELRLLDTKLNISKTCLIRIGARFNAPV